MAPAALAAQHIGRGDLNLAAQQLQLALASPHISQIQRQRYQARLDEVRDYLMSMRKRQIAEKFYASSLPNVDKLEAVDKSTVRITTSAPTADFLWSLGFCQTRIVPPETWAYTSVARQQAAPKQCRLRCAGFNSRAFRPPRCLRPKPRKPRSSLFQLLWNTCDSGTSSPIQRGWPTTSNL